MTLLASMHCCMIGYVTVKQIEKLHITPTILRPFVWLGDLRTGIALLVRAEVNECERHCRQKFDCKSVTNQSNNPNCDIVEFCIKNVAICNAVKP